MYGTGLLKGLAVTMKHWMSRKITEQYPEERPDLAPASQGFFNYDIDKCIACNLCVRACPNQVISLVAEKGENNKKAITSYKIDVQYCLYCGLCIEACPTSALTNANNFELACYHRESSHFEFVGGEPQKMNEAFEAIQSAYWSRRRSGGHEVAMPVAVKPAEAVKPTEAAKPVKPKVADKASTVQAPEAMIGGIAGQAERDKNADSAKAHRPLTVDEVKAQEREEGLTAAPDAVHSAVNPEDMIGGITGQTKSDMEFEAPTAHRPMTVQEGVAEVFDNGKEEN